MCGGKCLLQISSLDHSLSLGKRKAETQGKNPEAGTEAESMEKCSFLACSSGACPPCFQKKWNSQQSAQDWHHLQCDLGPLTSNISQENVPIDFSTCIFSIGVPSSQVILSCVKLTENKTKTNQTTIKTDQHCGSTGSVIKTSLEFPHNLDESLGNYIE